MDGWDRNANWNHDVLEHIVVLLFALAVLAERAAGLPCLRRRQILGILSYGEAEARAFVLGVEMPASSDAPERTGDAAELAARLRALALALCLLLARRFTLPGAAGVRAERRKPAARVGRPAAASAPDTS